MLNIAGSAYLQAQAINKYIKFDNTPVGNLLSSHAQVKYGIPLYDKAKATAVSAFSEMTSSLEKMTEMFNNVEDTENNLLTQSNFVEFNNVDFYSDNFNFSVENVAKETLFSTDEISSEDSSFGIGTIEIETNEGLFSFNVEKGENNLETLNNLADEINNSNINIKVEVKPVKSQNDYSQIVLELTGETGKENDFEIISKSDLPKFRKERESDDAIFSLNSIKIESSTNEFSLLDGKVAGKIIRETDTDLFISKKPFIKKEEKVEDFVNNLNKLFSVGKETDNKPLKELNETIFNILKEKEEQLNNVGIKINEDKSLSFTNMNQENQDRPNGNSFSQFQEFQEFKQKMVYEFKKFLYDNDVEDDNTEYIYSTNYQRMNLENSGSIIDAFI